MHATNIDAAIAHAEEVALQRPEDSHAWIGLASLHQQDGRRAEEARVWDAALTRLPAAADVLLAAGASDLRYGNREQAGARLLRAAECDPATTAPWLLLARDAEARTDLPQALKWFREAMRRDVAHATDVSRVGRALQTRGLVEAAAEALLHASEAPRESLEFWQELATNHLTSGRLAQAGAAVERALALSPAQGELHGLAGDILRKAGRVDAALRAYVNAARLAPTSAALLNKLGSAQKALGNRAAAATSMRNALAQDPGFALARHNLVTLLGENGERESARLLLREGATHDASDPEARTDFLLLLGLYEEFDRLAPIITQAVAQRTDKPILDALALVDDAVLPYDGVVLTALWEIARKAPATDGRDNRFVPLNEVWSSWPAFEAHFALHLGDDPAMVVRTLKGLAGGAEGAGYPGVPIAAAHYAHAVRLRGSLPLAGPHGYEQEARLRFWHAWLAQDTPAIGPGQVKLAPNFVESNPETPRTPPVSVAGTWRRMATGPWLRVPPGPWRAALLYFSMAEIHGFADGNGRVARLLVNLELERNGYRQLVFSDEITRSISANLAAVRTSGDLEPLVDLFAAAAADTTSLLRKVGVRPA